MPRKGNDRRRKVWVGDRIWNLEIITASKSWEIFYFSSLLSLYEPCPSSFSSSLSASYSSSFRATLFTFLYFRWHIPGWWRGGGERGKENLFTAFVFVPSSCFFVCLFFWFCLFFLLMFGIFHFLSSPSSSKLILFLPVSCQENVPFIIPIHTSLWIFFCLLFVPNSFFWKLIPFHFLPFFSF